MPYKIVSPRVGMPGDEYKPKAGENVAALLDGGFIVETATKPKTTKTESDTVSDNKE